MILPIILGILLSIIHFGSDRLFSVKSVRRMKFVSFTAGVFISYLILELFPTIFIEDKIFMRISLVFVLAGFSIFHLLEKYVYIHEKNRYKMKRELKEIHSITFFIYHLIIGIVLVNVFNSVSIMSGLLFFIPVAFITGVSSLSLKGIHGKIREKRTIKTLLSVSSLIGVLIAITFPLTQLLYSMLLGSVIGILLYIVIMDSIPKERKGEPTYFVSAVVLYSILIGLTWAFF